MRRKKKVYASFIDYILFHEDEIRNGVKEARADYSLYGCTRSDVPSGRKNNRSDRTASAVIHRAEKIKCVVCAMGETIYNPEEWLKIIDAVKQEAMSCKYPEIIFHEWETIYKDGMENYFGGNIWELVDDEKTFSPAGDSLTILRWIRNRVMEHAEEAGIWNRESPLAGKKERSY